MTHTIEKDDGIVVVRVKGEADLAALKAAVDDAATNAPGPLRLWDLTGAEIEVPAQDVMRLAAHGREALPDEARVAIVASDDLIYGLARMYEVYRAQEQSPHRIFRDETEARAWLLGP